MTYLPFFHSDLDISGDVALRVFADVGTTLEATFAITIKHTNIIKNIFTDGIYYSISLVSSLFLV